MISSRRCECVFVLALPFLLSLIAITSAAAQGIQTSPYSAANEIRRGVSPGGLDPAPSNPLGLPGSSLLGPVRSDTIPISSGLFQGILQRIPNLELGFIYSFGRDVRAGRGTADYLVPIDLGHDSTIFGELHAEFQDFWKAPSGGANNRVDLSFGGGCRTILRNTALVGLNGFYDTSRLFGSWYSSGSLGLEMAAITPDDGAIELNLNWYGNLFTRDGLINAFRNRGGSYDIEAGYSQPLFNQALDLRLKLTGYQFDIGTKVYGWRTGADVTTRDGVFTVKYEWGQDAVNGSYNSLGGFVNVGFQPENILRGESPFTAPEPVFQSPRNLLRMLTQKVKRNWHQPAAVVLARPDCGPYTVRGSQSPGYHIPVWGAMVPDGVIHIAESRINRITRVTLFLNINHTYRWELGITLVSPSGTQIWIMSFDGGSGHDIRILFDDDAAHPITDFTSSSPADGTYRPMDPLATFNGEPANGDWRLIVWDGDGSGGHSGTLNQWSLVISGTQ